MKLKGRIIGYDGDTNRIVIQLPTIPNEIQLNKDVEINGGK